jgi:hypothetical protein
MTNKPELNFHTKRVPRKTRMETAGSTEKAARKGKEDT